MTEEEIKQNANAYADGVYDRILQNAWWQECRQYHIAGAHSRDEEIEELKKKLEDMTKLKNLFALTLDIYDEELNELRNPWISVEERLPEQEKDEDGNKIGMSVEVFIRTEFVDNNHTYVHYGISRCYFNSDGGHEWQTPNVTHWMPIPELKKEDKL